jgi:hypothetical protein
MLSPASGVIGKLTAADSPESLVLQHHDFFAGSEDFLFGGAGNFACSRLSGGAWLQHCCSVGQNGILRPAIGLLLAAQLSARDAVYRSSRRSF